jgi:hypothetical protein
LQLYDNDTAFSDVFNRVGDDLLGRGYNCLPKEAANLTGSAFNVRKERGKKGSALCCTDTLVLPAN